MIEELHGKKETVHFDDGVIVKLHDNVQAEDYPMHWHLPIEIIMPVENHYVIRCKKTLYDLREGDILFVQPGVLHECIAPDTGRRFFCQVSLPLPVVASRGSSTLRLIAPPVMLITPQLDRDLHQKVRALLNQIYKKDDPPSLLANFSRYVNALQIVQLVYTFFEKNQAQFNREDPASKTEIATQIQYACTHIMERYQDSLTLESVASKIGFSKYHFARLFRAYTGETFYHYVNTVRTSNAQIMLADPSIPITDIAYTVGYSSMSSFIRMFKNFYDRTPSQYRKMLMQ